jgi:hypothetical protein
VGDFSLKKDKADLGSTEMALFGKYGQLFYQNNLKEKDC